MQNTTTEIDGLRILLGAHSCLILDPSKTSGANFRAALRQFGMASGKIFTATTVAEAEVFLHEKKPTLLIVDFNQDSSNSFCLIEQFEKLHPENARVALLATPGDRAAVHSDGQIDGQIVKPFNMDSLRRTLLKAMITKFYPDTYMKKILNADALSNRGEDEPARIEYEAARPLNPNPLRVHRGLAFLHQNQGRFEEAREEFKKARACSALDYKTVSGEFEALLTVGDMVAAAMMVPLLRDSFPTNAARLQKLFQTVVQAQKFEELLPLLKTFRDLPERSADLNEVVQASFFAAGQKAVVAIEGVSAFEFFDIGFNLASRRIEYVEKVVREFLKKGQREDAERFLTKSLADDVGSADFRRIYSELRSFSSESLRKAA